MADVELPGCRPEPLASYLKAVGVLRIVGDQLDLEARGRWMGDAFVLRGAIGPEALLDFFGTSWRPTPLVSPWNNGSGFKEEKNPSAVRWLSWVATSTDPRLANYREAIEVGRRMYAEAEARGWTKRQKIESCRNWLPDGALAWLDASVVLTNDDEVFPPLLGTGGNDGRFDFTVAYMARLADIWDGSPSGSLGSRKWLAASLFDSDPTPVLSEAVGQFDPGAAGGISASSTGSAEGLVNPWDWLLCLEGALAFAGASARRLGATTRGRAAIPFTLGPAPVGYVTSSREETTRGELWTPLWSGWASAREVTRLLGEGRVEWRGTQAANGLDAARALADLGVDRGVSSFIRNVSVERNGKSTLAVPVGRLEVRQRTEVPVTGQLDGWLAAIRRDGNPPAGVRTALHRLETAMFSVAVHGGRRQLQDVLIRGAELDSAVGRARAFQSRTRVVPLLLGDREGWLGQLDDGSPEYRLAAGFASLRDRINEGQPWADRATLGRLLRPVRYDDGARRLIWCEAPAQVGGLGALPLLTVLADAHVRRGVATLDRDNNEDNEVELVGVQPGYDYGRPVPLGDVAALLGGDVDVERVESLLTGLMRLDWAAGGSQPAPQVSAPSSILPAGQSVVPAALVLLAPCYLSRGGSVGWRASRDGLTTPVRVRAQPDWLPRLRAGQVGPVLRAAATRLRLAGVDLAVGRRPRLAADQMAALGHGVDGRALAAVLLLRLRTSEVTRALRRLAPFEPTTDRVQETA